MDCPDHLGQPVTIRPATLTDEGDWAQLRHELWSTGSVSEHGAEISQLLVNPGETLNLIARTPTGLLVGFAEASIRHDYVNGCDSSPVAFLEGIYVRQDYRRLGYATHLVAAVESWALAQGCSEMASDADIANHTSHSMHEALGFAETQRVVYFRKGLSAD